MGFEPAIKILIVEDELITATAIAEVLEEWGYKVVGIAPSGGEALEKAFSLKPDLILMDIRLRGPIDGVQVARRIQTRLNVPMIYLTAHSDEETLKRALFTHPYGYIIKPIQEQELHATIVRALDMHQTRR